MTIRLGHYSIRAHDLGEAQRFYTDVLGLRVGFRPPFSFRGVWLYAGDDDSGHGLVHLIGAGADDYLGSRVNGGGALDHIAFTSENLESWRERLLARQIPFEERAVPDLGLRQMFLSDPDGIVVELNFPTGAED